MTVTTARAAVQLPADELEDLQRTVRVLLAHPLVTETWPQRGALVAVRRWETVLRNELGRVLGYRLEVGRTCARLYRKPATLSTARGPRSRTQRLLGPLACSYLCLVLAAVEGLGEQTTASQVADEVQRLRAGDDALPVDLTDHGQRRAFVHALKWLEDRGVLQLRDGEADQWLTDPDGDALYDLDRDVVSRLLVTAPSVLRDVEVVEDFLIEPPAASDEARLQRVRHRTGRRIIGEPVVAFTDLTDDELAHFRHRRSRIVGDIERLTGCTVEVRSEGIALVDADRDPISGERFPASGTETQAALLWGAALVELADQTRDGRTDGHADSDEPWAVVDEDAADQRWAEVVDAYGSRFKVEYRENPERLRLAVKDLLARFGLLDVDADGTIRCHAALARYRPSADDTNGAGDTGEDDPASLWDGDDR